MKHINKKITNIILTITLNILILTLSACSKKVEVNTVRDTEEIITEDDTNEESSTKDSDTTSEVEEENGDNIDSEFEDIKRIEIFDEEIELPCTLGELKKHFRIEDKFPNEDYENTLFYSMLVGKGENSFIALVYCKDGADNPSDDDYVYGVAGEEGDFYDMPFAVPMNFEIDGVNEKMSKSEVISLWGEPDEDNGFEFYYYDENYSYEDFARKPYGYDVIILSWVGGYDFDNGQMLDGEVITSFGIYVNIEDFVE
ncbi:MAG: hypothetical protein IJ763_09210 [Lachnospiraceae bacterium]|nr:hypothetical protein [Lachnospiraceae bacterium]